MNVSDRTKQQLTIIFLPVVTAIFLCGTFGIAWSGKWGDHGHGHFDRASDPVGFWIQIAMGTAGSVAGIVWTSIAIYRYRKDLKSGKFTNT